MAPRVLLLRTPQETDRYEEALKSAEFCPFSLPVLETMLENREQLFDIVRPKKAEDGRVDEVDGVIVTSARAVEACANAGDIDWREKPFYVVGPATAAALRARLPNPPQDIRGMESGSTEQLAQYIVENATGFKRLLYLTGDKNREKLPRIVMERLGDGVLTKLRVYSTRGVRDFEGSLKRALQGEPGTFFSSFYLLIASEQAGILTHGACQLKLMMSHGGSFFLHRRRPSMLCLRYTNIFQ